MAATTGQTLQTIQHSLLKYSAQGFKIDLQKNNPILPEQFKVALPSLVAQLQPAQAVVGMQQR